MYPISVILRSSLPYHKYVLKAEWCVMNMHYDIGVPKNRNSFTWIQILAKIKQKKKTKKKKREKKNSGIGSQLHRTNEFQHFTNPPPLPGWSYFDIPLHSDQKKRKAVRLIWGWLAFEGSSVGGASLSWNFDVCLQKRCPTILCGR